MIEPKIFYRKLDFILNRIGGEKSGKDFLFTIVKELENTFGQDMHLYRGRVYEEYEAEFALIYPEDSSYGKMTQSLDLASPEVQAVIKNHSYIYDDPGLSLKIYQGKKRGYSIPVALTVHSTEYRWIIVFELEDGWIREEVEFCLNAVRASLNYRLYNEAIKNEMTQAANIQQSLLPFAVPEIEGYDIACRSIPAEIVGGDFYDFYKMSRRRYGISVGDASGHGMPAALLVRDVVTGLRMGIDEDDSLFPKRKHLSRGKMQQKLNELNTVEALQKLNRVIFKSTYSTRFVSLIYACFDKDGQFFYVNAGHPSPLLVNRNKLQELQSTGPIFGALPEIKLHSQNGVMEEGDVLVLFSDGLPERMNEMNGEFGMERLKELVMMYRHKPAREMLNIIFGVIQDYGKSPKWEDDATLLIIKKV